jgi:acyl-CoA thioester hydrolase
MTEPTADNEQPHQMTVPIRVRYVECDPMNVAHHSAYLPWLEIARSEMLRRDGMSYADCEKAGVFFVVARVSVRYRKPTHYDQMLDVEVIRESAGRFSLEHAYRVTRDQELVAEATTTLVCVDSEGKPQSIPQWLSPDAGA